ncbi:sulfate ABC transporter permease [bacterium]|nr:sulfate ABC transporter permease [candidate division CSSED10-310 bacterium]
MVPNPFTDISRSVRRRDQRQSPRRYQWFFLRRDPRLMQRLLIAAVLAWLAFLIAFPLIGIITHTFADGWRPFVDALIEPEAMHAFIITLLVTGVAVMINVVFGIIIGLVIARHQFPGKILVEELVSLPLAVSPVVAGFMFILLFGRNGWLGSWFEAGGVRIIYALPGMIIATIFVTLPFVSKEVIPVLLEIGTEMEDAARTLGASPWQVFRYITFPSIRWGLAYGITLTTARALGEFGAVLVVSGNIIGRTQTATLHIHESYTNLHFQGAFSASLVLAVISFTMLLVMEFFRRRIEKSREN